MHSPASNLTVKTSLCTGETKLSDAKSASKKQGEGAHNLVRVGHVGWPGGKRVRGKQRVMLQHGARGREQRSAGEGLRARAHTCGAESTTLLNIYSHITDLMAFNGRLCKRSGIGTKGAEGIIILTRGAKEHGKIRAEQSR